LKYAIRTQISLRFGDVDQQIVIDRSCNGRALGGCRSDRAVAAGTLPAGGFQDDNHES
jgi:hypothetical protein